MSPAIVRYIVDDVEEALAFYCTHLGLDEKMHPAPGFALLALDDLRLALNATGGQGGASQPMPDGRVPVPGGWNRIQLEVSDLDEIVQRLRTAGVSFRNEIVDGFGGRQVLAEDPSGNVVELFEPGDDPAESVGDTTGEP
jgi:catechol 2,3-dioxygenase-like lactoylglutathione lyase family enzyme